MFADLAWRFQRAENFTACTPKHPIKSVKIRSFRQERTGPSKQAVHRIDASKGATAECLEVRRAKPNLGVS
jgi:hypothetical protein